MNELLCGYIAFVLLVSLLVSDFYFCLCLLEFSYYVVCFGWLIVLLVLLVIAHLLIAFYVCCCGLYLLLLFFVYFVAACCLFVL